MYCINCGAYIPESSDVCVACGHSVRYDMSDLNSKDRHAIRSNFMLPTDRVRVDYGDRILDGKISMQNVQRKTIRNSNGTITNKEIFTLTFETSNVHDGGYTPRSMAFDKSSYVSPSDIRIPCASAACTIPDYRSMAYVFPKLGNNF